MDPRAVLVEQLLELAWSHWAALGVAGSVPAATEPVDLEALLLLTAELATVDPRLRDESLDWCSKYHGFISKPRLKQLFRRFPASAQSSFAALANDLERHAGSGWPGSTGALDGPRALSGKSQLPPLSHPALLALRLRALFGVGARADVICAVLLRSSGDFGAADLVPVGYSKRNLAEALDMLAAGGLFRTARVSNRVRFSWQRHEALASLLAPLPDDVPPWAIRIRFMSGVLDLLTRLQGKSDRLCAVEAARFFREFSAEIDALRIEAPTPAGITSSGVSSWALATTAQLVRRTRTAQRKAPRASR